MADIEKNKAAGRDTDALPSSSASPLVFISHDSRDAELAEAFSKLLKSVSAGMLKCFRSSDKKGNEGFQFGDEWYTRLMDKLQAASEVVCLFTKRSIDRPWILYEAGIAKAKLDTRVRAIVFGVPLASLQTGPFFHFQNLESTEESLSKLVLELAGRVSGLEPDADVIRTQVKAFKTTSDKIVAGLSQPDESETARTDENPMAKFLEEMKVLVRDLPSRVTEQMNETGGPDRRRRRRRIHPMMFDHMMHMNDDPEDPIGLLLAASMVRDDMPWFYEIVLEAYHAIRSGDSHAAEREVTRLRNLPKMLMHGPFMDEFGDKDMHMFMMEFPRMFEHAFRRYVDNKKPTPRRGRRAKPQSEA
jgi:hypothetical protein